MSIWWTPADQLFAKYLNSIKYSIVANLIASLPDSNDIHSPLRDVENSYVDFQYGLLTSSNGYLLQALYKFYNYIAGGGMQYVDRGDPATVDFSVGDFITDESWHDLDLSAIVPAGAPTVFMALEVEDGQAENYIKFRKKGNTNSENVQEIRTQVAGIRNTMTGLVSLDTDRKLEYMTTATTWTRINLTVRGWFT